MGKHQKRDYRAEQVHRQREEKRRQQEKAQQRRAWWTAKERKWQILAVVVVILAAWLLLEYNVGMGGSIPTFFGKLVGAEENWIIGNAADQDASPRYYRLAESQAPEGYTEFAYHIGQDELVQYKAYRADSEGSLVKEVMIAPLQGRTASWEIGYMAISAGNRVNSGEVQGQIAGKDASYIYIVFEDAEATAEAKASRSYASLSVCFDAPQGTTVKALLNSRTVETDSVPALEEMVREADRLLAGLTIAE